MKKSILLTLTLALLPIFACNASAAGLHVAAGLPNYRLIIGCVIGGALVIFLLAMFTMKYRRKDDKAAPAEENQVKTESAEDENND